MLLGVVFKQTGAAPLTEVPVKGPYSKHDFMRSARFHGVEFNMPPVFPIPAQAPSRMVLWAKQQERRGRRATRQGVVSRVLRRRARHQQARHRGGGRAAKRASTRHRRAPPSTIRPIKDALKREVDGAIGAGVFGSPFVVVDGEPFWGLDRFDQIERWLREGGF